MEQTRNKGFNTKLGVILAAAGSAVGLGNIWKFPYMAGENGGGAFLIVYLVCVLLFGLPLIMTEFIIGKRAGKSAFGAFRSLSGNNRWQWLGWLCLLTAFIIMGFYFVVTGWCFNYLYESLFNAFNGLGTDQLTEHFTSITSNTPRMIAFGIVPVLLTAAVLWFDVNKGIERLSKILMPFLLIMMLLMAGRVLMLDGSNAGMRFFFQIDFSKITPHVILEAMGQSFFSLSIGMGALITYGSYMPKSQNVMRTSLEVITLDTLVAVMAGVIIFPAVFAFGFNPAEGPKLVFVVLPAIFQQMSFSWLSSLLFFALLCVAALTSTISLMEVAVSFICEASHGKLNRHKSVLIVSALVILLIVACVLFPMLFNWFDEATACVMMPLGAFSMSMFVGWFMLRRDKQFVLQGQNRWKRWLHGVFIFSLRWIVPLAILLIFLNSLGII